MMPKKTVDFCISKTDELGKKSVTKTTSSKKAQTPLPHTSSPSFILCMQMFFLQEYIDNDNVLSLWK